MYNNASAEGHSRDVWPASVSIPYTFAYDPLLHPHNNGSFCSYFLFNVLFSVFLVILIFVEISKGLFLDILIFTAWSIPNMIWNER